MATRRSTARAALAAGLALGAAPATAHGELPVLPNAVWQTWNFDPLVLVPLLLLHWLYGRGVLRAWARAGSGRVIARWRVGGFVAGEIALLAALVSPIDPLGGTLLTAHMIQHMLLVVIAPPLLLAGLPGVALAWAMPPRVLQSRAMRGLGRLVERLSRPVAATVLHALALWAWHAPPAFDAALENEWMHTAEHLSFLLSALLFWHALFRSGRRAGTAAAGGLAAFVTFVHSGMLGGLLSLAPQPLYSDYDAHAPYWGLTGLEDQQFAGLIMWVPTGPLYLAAALVLASRLLRPAPLPIIPGRQRLVVGGFDRNDERGERLPDHGGERQPRAEQRHATP